MSHKEINRLDRFAFALGSVAVGSSYAAIPVVPNDRIAAAWDERLSSKSGKAESGRGRVRSRVGWAT
jgi:hypothetical protein